MAQFRLSRPAQADLGRILAASGARWGDEGRRRYAAILVAAMRQIAADPESPLARQRDDILRGIRSLPLRHVRTDRRTAVVKHPVHVIYYRAVPPDIIEIVRILHERMEPGRHLDRAADEDEEP